MAFIRKGLVFSYKDHEQQFVIKSDKQLTAESIQRIQDVISREVNGLHVDVSTYKSHVCSCHGNEDASDMCSTGNYDMEETLQVMKDALNREFSGDTQLPVVPIEEAKPEAIAPEKVTVPKEPIVKPPVMPTPIKAETLPKPTLKVRNSTEQLADSVREGDTVPKKLAAAQQRQGVTPVQLPQTQAPKQQSPKNQSKSINELAADEKFCVVECEKCYKQSYVRANKLYDDCFCNHTHDKDKKNMNRIFSECPNCGRTLVGYGSVTLTEITCNECESPIDVKFNSKKNILLGGTRIEN